MPVISNFEGTPAQRRRADERKDQAIATLSEACAEKDRKIERLEKALRDAIAFSKVMMKTARSPT